MTNHIKKTSSIINLTGKPFNMYDDITGSIISFPPTTKKILSLPRKKNIACLKSDRTYYVVKSEDISEIVAARRTLDDIAIVTSQSAGRNGAMIATLAWAKKPNYKVRFARK